MHDLDVINDSGEAGAPGTGGGGGGGGGSTYHPSKVHYIFSDDDGSEELTSALLRISQSTPHQPPEDESGSKASLQDSTSNKPTNSTTSNSSSSSAAFRRDKQFHSKDQKRDGKEGEREREERVIILDVNEDLSKVTKISSLSPNWQVVSASLSNAPSFDYDPSNARDGGNGERGVMLKIEGIGSSNLQSRHKDNDKEIERERERGKSGLRDSGTGSGLGVGMGEEEMNSLMEVFDRKMAVLRSVVGNVASGGAVVENRGEEMSGRRGSRGGSRLD